MHLSLFPSSTTSSTSSITSLESTNESTRQLASYRCLTSFEPSKPTTSAPALAIASSSSFLISASAAEILIINLKTLIIIETITAVPTAGSVKSVTTSPNGLIIYTAHQDGRIRTWRRSARTDRHRLTATLPTTTDRLRRLPLPANYVTVRRHRRRLWIEHADAVSGLAVTPAGTLYSASWDKTLKVWRGDRCAESVAAGDDAVNAVVASGDGIVYTGSADGKIRAWRVPAIGGAGGDRRRRKHQLIATLEGHKSTVNALTVAGDNDGEVLLSCGGDGRVVVWGRDGEGRHVVTKEVLRGHRGAVLCLAGVGDVVFSGGGDRTVRIWRRGESKKYECVGVMEGHVTGVRSIVAVLVSAWEGDMVYRVCSGSLHGEIRVWEVRM